jgi:hypothetical protein
MAIIPTKYIYPLEQEINLFLPLGLTFDNPRTENEIRLVKEFLSKTLQFENKRFDKANSEQSLRVIFGIGELRKYLERADKESFALKYYKDNPEKSLIDILSETWIVVRFKEEENFENIMENRDLLFNLILTQNENVYTKRFIQILNISHVISILTHNEDLRYCGESFLLTKNAYDIFYSIERYSVHDVLEESKGYNFLLENENRVNSWLYWLDVKNSLITASNKLAELYKAKMPKQTKGKISLSQKQSTEQKIIHVGNQLRISYNHTNDPELMLILLVGIIEYLLTRNSDSNRFNVEDSINKQFRLKTAIAINADNHLLKLNELNQTLADIYDQRSNIAHGNFIENYSQKEIVNSVLKLYQYLKHILNTFISNRELIEYLKDS